MVCGRNINVRHAKVLYHSKLGEKGTTWTSLTEVFRRLLLPFHSTATIPFVSLEHRLTRCVTLLPKTLQQPHSCL